MLAKLNAIETVVLNGCRVVLRTVCCHFRSESPRAMATTRSSILSFALMAVCAALTGCGAAGGAGSLKTFQDCDVCPPMVEIAPGSFLMGAEGGEEGRPEGPVHRVSITRPFALASTETTLAAFRLFVSDSGYEPAEECRTLVDGSWQNSERHSWREPGATIEYDDDSPVVCVSWRDAVAYTEWLSRRSGVAYRLPSEAEWEYAARGGSNGIFFWGDDAADGCRFANLYDRSAAPSLGFRWDEAPCSDGYVTLAPVGALAPNPFGLYDMLGNVWEWTADCYIAPYPEVADPQRPITSDSKSCERRSVRGGGWITRPDRQRLTFRGRDPEQRRMSYFGFRVARSL